MKKKAIFLFAHQDDEVGITKVILNELADDNEVICIFITDGGKKNEIRNQESISVLVKIGVNKKNIYFLGKEFKFKDGMLSKKIKDLQAWISKYIKDNNHISSMYVTAYEGGHQDHDALHVATVKAAYENGVIDSLYQFPLYNRYKCIGPFFSVMKPLSANGKVIKINMTIKERVQALFYCLQYSSQLKTWIGLFPFFLIYYLMNSHQIIQKVPRERIDQKPHEGTLLYEYRKYYDWSSFAEDAK